MDKVIGFTNDYDKFHRDLFFTVRGIGYMKEHNISLNDVCKIHSPHWEFYAQLIGFEDIRIRDIDLSFLKYDCSPMKCETYEEYVNGINDFTQYHNTTIDTVKRILYFWKTIGTQKRVNNMNRNGVLDTYIS